MITPIGGILFPLCCLFFNRPWSLLALIFYYSVFSAAAMFVVGGAGVTPGLLPASLFILTFAVGLCTDVRYPQQRQALIILTPFILVVTGALISSVVMPRLFLGEVYVWPQKTELFVRTPLAPNAGNYTQDMYFLCDALLTVTASIYLTRGGAKLSRLLDCYLSASFFADGISLWQFLGNTVHIWYPSTFFLSNPGWAQLSLESIGSLIRLNGPFSEPSSLSAYLSSTVCAAGWLLLKGDKRLMPRLALLFGLGIITLSTATTGFATLGVMCGLLLLRSVVASSAQFRRRVFVTAIGAVFLGSVVSSVTPIIAPGIASQASLIFTATMTKNQSSSYQDRTESDRDSFNEMLETSGLGVGWGSNRSSSLLPGLCASIGIWGIVGLVWFGAVIVVRLRSALRSSTDSEYHRVIGAISAAVLTTLVAGFVSEPTISSPDFYLLLAMLVAAASSSSKNSLLERKEAAAHLKVENYCFFLRNVPKQQY